MSRKYQGRHRALPVSPLHSARVALPALAAASLTVAAAGTAVATDVGPQTRANASAGFTDTTQWTRSSTAGVSRSTTRSAALTAKAAAAAKSKSRTAAANRALAARNAKARSAALSALATSSGSASDYTQPAPKPEPKPEPQPTTRQATNTQRSAVASRASRSSTRSTQAATTRTSSSSDAPSYGSGRWTRPLAGGSFTSGYGYRWGRMHAGVDFACPVGTSLRSMGSGTVIAAGWYGGQGKRMVVRFDNGVEAHYAHMSGFSASVGERVSPGETIGYSGNTGNSTGPHLHLEIHVGGSPINPAGWLSARGLL